MPTLTPPIKLEERLQSGGGGRPPREARPFGGGGGGRGPDGDPTEMWKLAVWVGLAGVIMFFSAIVSAMIIRRGGGNWQALDMPAALWVSTILLLLSSGTYELARRQLNGGTDEKLRQWLSVSLGLGIGFLIAQAAGWAQLIQSGILVGESASGSFFYILTAAHGLHVTGGIAALGYVNWRARSERPWPTRSAALDAAGVYWHFMDALWIALLILLAVYA